MERKLEKKKIEKKDRKEKVERKKKDLNKAMRKLLSRLYGLCRVQQAHANFSH